MINQYFVKSFSKGQITIPKKYRDTLNIKGEFWVKINLEPETQRIVLEVQKPADDSGKVKTVGALLDFLKTIKPIKDLDVSEYKKIRSNWRTHKRYDY